MRKFHSGWKGVCFLLIGLGFWFWLGPWAALPSLIVACVMINGYAYGRLD